MRLSISDGLQLDAGASLAPPKVPQLRAPPAITEAPANRPRARLPSSPGELRDERRPSDPFALRRSTAQDPQLAAPALFTGPPTALSHSNDLAKLQTVDTPADGHTTSDHPHSTQEGGNKTWRRFGVLLLVAAAGAGGWFFARQSATTSAPASLAVSPPAAPEPKPVVVDTSKAVTAELVRPPAESSKPVEPTKAIEPAKAVVPGAAAPVKVIDPMAPPVVRAAPAKAVAAKVEAPASAPTQAAAEAPAEAPAPGAEEAAAMAAVPDQHEFNKAAARSALEEAADSAASCRNVDTPAGAARVAVTFAPSGKVTSAVIESGPFVGTASGGCVASKFRNLHVPPFTSDDPVTVHKTITF
jgi:hypothetical protein